LCSEASSFGQNLSAKQLFALLLQTKAFDAPAAQASQPTTPALARADHDTYLASQHD
jgi:hypothetical protein